MNKAVLLLGTACILFCGRAGGSSSPGIEISCDMFNRENFITEDLTTNSGDEITIKLCSNPSTGFQWSENPKIPSLDVLIQESHGFQIQSEKGISLPPGTPGVEIWTFHAESPGQSRVYFEYSRDWEEGEKGIWIFNLNIIVK